MRRQPSLARSARRSLGAALGILLGSTAAAQTLDDARSALRQSLQSSAALQSLGNLVLVSDEFELSSARYQIDDPFDTELNVFAIPARNTFRFDEDARVGLYVEGVLGYANLSESTTDVYGGALPGLETSINADTRTFGGLLGVGPEFEVLPGLTFTPIANLGIARIENEADYGGPGAVVSAPLFDGIAFNWDALTISYGGAARVTWTYPFAEDYEWRVTGRYDLRRTETIDTDDPAQEFNARQQLLSIRSDVVGPTGWDLLGGSVRWRATVGYRRLLEGGLGSFEDTYEFGGGLELGDVLPLGAGLSLSGAVLLGDDITGWTIGLGFSL